MLLCMYCCWVEKYGFKVEILEYYDGEEVGIKLVILLIKGENVYGWLKIEFGVYCLVWILFYDSNVCWYISFFSVWVYLVIDDLIEIDVNESDCWIDIYCVLGVGG